MKDKLNTLLTTAILLALAQLNLQAVLLVADGGTTSRTTGINLLPADLVAGTNGGNTMVNTIAPGTVTNAGGFTCAITQCFALGRNFSGVPCCSKLGRHPNGSPILVDSWDGDDSLGSVPNSVAGQSSQHAL